MRPLEAGNTHFPIAPEVLRNEKFNEKCDVFSMGEDGNADGVDSLKWGLHEMEQDFQVVNHDVKDNANVHATLGKGRESVYFDESRIRLLESRRRIFLLHGMID